MTEEWITLRDKLRRGPEELPVDTRRNMVRAIGETILCRSVDSDPVIDEILDLLTCDTEWPVRLEIARILHLLEDETCSRIAAQLCQDSNQFVRNHADRSLSRQRKARRSANRKRSEQRGLSGRLNELTRRYGQSVAATVQALADQRFGTLASAVAHDVRSILTTLLPNATALAAELGPESRAFSVLEDVRFLKRTLEAMEQFSKPLPDNRSPEEVRPMIQQAIEKARAGVIEQGYDCSAVTILIDDVPEIRLRVVRRLIVLALTNVVQNAIECFCDRRTDVVQSGHIEIQVVVDGYETRILVQDNGPGIEPEVVNELSTFMPTGPNKSKRYSSGWGLSLVHRYITAHGGSVVIDSTINAGTTVVLALPMRDTDEGSEA